MTKRNSRANARNISAAGKKTTNYFSTIPDFWAGVICGVVTALFLVSWFWAWGVSL